MEENTTVICMLSLEEQIHDELLNQNVRPDHREGWAELNPHDFQEPDYTYVGMAIEAMLED